MGLWDSIKSYAHSADFLGIGNALGAPRQPSFPKFPKFDPLADMQKALTAEQHQQAAARSAYSLSDFILTGGKPATYKSPLGG